MVIMSISKLILEVLGGNGRTYAVGNIVAKFVENRSYAGCF